MDKIDGLMVEKTERRGFFFLKAAGFAALWFCFELLEPIGSSLQTINLHLSSGSYYYIFARPLKRFNGFD